MRMLYVFSRTKTPLHIANGEGRPLCGAEIRERFHMQSPLTCERPQECLSQCSGGRCYKKLLCAECQRLWKLQEIENLLGEAPPKIDLKVKVEKIEAKRKKLGFKFFRTICSQCGEELVDDLNQAFEKDPSGIWCLYCEQRHGDRKPPKEKRKKRPPIFLDE